MNVLFSDIFLFKDILKISYDRLATNIRNDKGNKEGVYDTNTP